MKTYLDCIPFFMQQALRAGRIVTSDEKELKHNIVETKSIYPELEKMVANSDDVDLNIKLKAWENIYNFPRPHAAFSG